MGELVDAARFLVVALIIIVTLLLIGFPFALLFTEQLGGRLTAALSPMFGFSVLAVIGWYWSDRPAGIRPVVIALPIVGALTVGIALARPKTRARVQELAIGMASLWPGALFAVGAVSILYFPVTSTGYFTTVTAGNLDIAFTAITTRHVLDHGFTGETSVEGFHPGLEARPANAFFGMLPLVAVPAAIFDTAPWRTTTPVLMSVLMLGVVLSVTLVEVLFGLSRFLAAMLGTLPWCTFFLAYAASHGFLPQLLGMALILAELVLLLTVSDWRNAPVRHAWAPVLPGALLVAAGVLTYSHMQLFAPAVIIAACFARLLVTGRARRGLRVALGSACALVLGALVVAVPTLNFVRDLGGFESITAGWELPPVSAVNLLGFQRDFVRGWSGIQWIGTVLLISIVALAAIALWRRKPGITAFAIVTVGFITASSWLLANHYSGDAYRVWKWVSFFQPLALIVALGLCTVALMEIFRATPQFTSARAIVAGVLAGLLGVALVNGRVAFDRIREGDYLAKQYNVLTPDLAALSHNPTLRSLRRIDIQLGTQYEQLFALDIVPTRLKRSLRPSYIRVVRPASEYTLVRMDEISAASVPGLRVLNATYALVPTKELPPAG